MLLIIECDLLSNKNKIETKKSILEHYNPYKCVLT